MSLKSLGVIAVIGVMFAGPLAACSSDVELSANDRFCADASQLKIDLRSLASFDVITLGTASLKAQIKAVQGDLDALKISA